MVTTYTATVKANQATIRDNKLGRKFLNPVRTDCPLYVCHFTYTNNTAAALADGTIIDLGTVLGPGVILPQSFIHSDALGASRVLNLGFNNYKNVDSGADVDGLITALLSGVDVSAAYNKFMGDITAGTNPSGYELIGPAPLLAQVTGGTIPINAVIAGTLYISKIL